MVAAIPRTRLHTDDAVDGAKREAIGLADISTRNRPSDTGQSGRNQKAKRAPAYSGSACRVAWTPGEFRGATGQAARQARSRISPAAAHSMANNRSHRRSHAEQPSQPEEKQAPIHCHAPVGWLGHQANFVERLAKLSGRRNRESLPSPPFIATTFRPDPAISRRGNLPHIVLTNQRNTICCARRCRSSRSAEKGSRCESGAAPQR
jgi:hypothetical protein